MKNLTLIMLALLTFAIAPLPAQALSQGKSTVEEAYEVYRVRYDYENDRYALSVYDGIFKGDVTFAIYFSPATPSAYALSATIKDVAYEIPAHEGTVSLVAVSFARDFSLSVHDANGVEEPLYIAAEFSIDEASTIKADPACLAGKGLSSGIKVVTLSKAGTKTTRQVALWVALAVAVGLVLVLSCFAIFGATNSFLYTRRKNQQEIDFTQLVTKPADEFAPVMPDAPLPEALPPVAKSVPRAPFDFAAHFASLSLPWGKKDASEDEKNAMMLELMHLKGEGIITEEEYKEESVVLWKK